MYKPRPDFDSFLANFCPEQCVLHDKTTIERKCKDLPIGGQGKGILVLQIATFIVGRYTLV